jgi:hypothetical protein
MLSVGLGAPPASITGIKSAIVSHFAVSGAAAQGMTAAQ